LVEEGFWLSCQPSCTTSVTFSPDLNWHQRRVSFRNHRDENFWCQIGEYGRWGNFQF